MCELLDNDIPGIDESRLRETTRGAGPIVTCADGSSGQDEPDTSDRREATATCNERVIIRPEEPGRDNGLDEAVTAEMVGQVAIDLCDKKPGGDSGLDEIVTAEMVGQMAIDLSDKPGGDFPI